MPIFDMYGGRQNLYTKVETDRINNPEKYNYTQAQYDAFIASLDAKVKARRAVDERSRELVPTSYANFGTAGTNPGFSLAGMAGHTSGGLAGNAGTAQYADGGRVEQEEQEGIGALFEQKMLDEQIAELGLQPVTMTNEELLEIGYEDPNDFRRARIAQGQLGNSEYEWAIRDYMGPDGASYVDHTRVKTLLNSPNYDVQGVYYPAQPNLSYEEAIERLKAGDKGTGYDKAFQENDMEGAEPDMVYILGGDNANPQTLSHEFRHRGFRAKFGEGREKLTRFYDAWLSRTPEEWEDAVIYHRINPPRAGQRNAEGLFEPYFSSYEEAEQDLLKKLQEARPELLEAEVDSMEDQHLSRRRQANLASLDEKGIIYTQAQYDAFEERDREAREHNLAIRTDMADFRARSRRPIRVFERNPDVLDLEGYEETKWRNFGDGGAVQYMDPILEHHYRNLAEGKSVNNDDGSVSTVYTAQVDIDGIPTLIPTLWDGQVLSVEDATQRALASGKTWPTAETHEDLRKYDIELHKEMTPMTAEDALKILRGSGSQQRDMPAMETVNPTDRGVPEGVEGDRKLKKSLAVPFRQAGDTANIGNMGFDGRNITGRGTVMVPIKGNRLELGANAFLGSDGAGIAGLDASYYIPDRGLSFQGGFRPEDKSWRVSGTKDLENDGSIQASFDSQNNSIGVNLVKNFLNQGGVVRREDPVQYMGLGGMASPYADPMKAAVQQTTMGPQLGEQPLGPRGQMGGQQGGVGGLFQKMHQNQMGMMQAQMGGAPLQVYGEYLNNIYTAPEAEASQAQVAEFIDMVDQAERAHFGAEESFGYGGGSYQQGLMSQYEQDIPPPQQGGQMTGDKTYDQQGLESNIQSRVY